MPRLKKATGSRGKKAGKKGVKGKREKDYRGRRAKKKVCQFCSEKIVSVDYKDISRLKRFMSERGKILPNRITGNCSRHQRLLTSAVKRGRILALLPYSV